MNGWRFPDFDRLSAWRCGRQWPRPPPAFAHDGIQRAQRTDVVEAGNQRRHARHAPQQFQHRGAAGFAIRVSMKVHDLDSSTEPATSRSPTNASQTGIHTCWYARLDEYHRIEPSYNSRACSPGRSP